MICAQVAVVAKRVKYHGQTQQSQKETSENKYRHLCLKMFFYFLLTHTRRGIHDHEVVGMNSKQFKRSERRLQIAALVALLLKIKELVKCFMPLISHHTFSVDACITSQN